MAEMMALTPNLVLAGALIGGAILISLLIIVTGARID